MMFKNKINNNSLWVAVFITLWSILIYSNSLNSSFHYDDYRNIINNPDIKWEELSFENFNKIFFVREGLPQGRPITFLTFSLNYYLGGFEVQGYHLVNLAIHIFTGFGLFLLLETVFSLPISGYRLRERSSIMAFIASLLWLSSPLQTQAVTYIVQRMAALAAMFYVYAIYFYLKGRIRFDDKRYVYYFFTVLFAVLAFASKENSYTLPLYLLLSEFILIRKGDYRFFLERWILCVSAVLVVAFGVIIWYHYASWLAMEPGPWMTYQYKTRFLTGCRVIWFYVFQLLLPVPSRLSLEHDFELSRSFLDPLSTAFSVIFLFSLIFYQIKSVKRQPLLAFFILWFFGNLFIETFYPFLKLVFEHRLYLPSMGFFAIIAVGLGSLHSCLEKKYLRNILLLVVCLILVLFAINTYSRNKAWKDEYTIGFDLIEKNPNMVPGYINVGAAYTEDKLFRKALPFLEKARSLQPRNPKIRYDLGLIYFNLKKYEKALFEFNFLGSMGYVGVGQGPSASYYYSKIARNYYGHGNIPFAIKTLEDALVYSPDEPELKELKSKIESGNITNEEIMK